MTRARKRAKIYFATNRRTHGMWKTNIPSRFLDELPEGNVEVTESKGSFGGAAGYGASRFDNMTAFGSNYSTPGWQRAQANKNRGGFSETGAPRYGDKGVGDNSLDYVQPDYDDDAPATASRAGAPRRSRRSASARAPLTIEGELVAKSTGAASDFSVGDRVFHQKFGNGNVTVVDGNKLTIAFDRAGEKRVVD